MTESTSERQCELSSSLAWDDWDRYETVCREFERRWREGERPLAESWLPQAPPAWQEALLEDLLCIEIEYRRRQGERVDRHTLSKRFPGRRSWIEGLLHAARGEEQVLVAGEIVGRYRIEGLVARGAFGSVYRAYDETLERTVAIKVARHAPAGSVSSAQLRHESQLLASLCHPHIVPVYDVGELENGAPYVVLEFLSGNSLDERLRQQPVPWRQAVEWMAQIAEAIHYVHRRGTIHRDLKPANIVLDSENRARVTDFGLAFQLPSATSRAEGFAGTPCYMAPEQLTAPGLSTSATDIWSLGAILYEMLTGARPYTREQLERAADGTLPPAVPAPSTFNDAVPPALDRICAKCLKFDPDERFASAGQLARQLRRCLAPPPVVSRRRVVGAIALAGATGLGAWWWQRRGTPIPINCDLRVLAWNPTQGPRWVDQPGALPLTERDTVRVQVTVDRPSHLYVVWIDESGEALPLHPEEGSWSWRDSVPRTSLGLPDTVDEGWQMAVRRPGMETVLVMARRRPLSDREVDAVRHTLAQWQPQPPVRFPTSFAFHNGRLQHTAKQRLRRPEVDTSAPIRHPLFANQRLIAETLVPQGLDVVALTFSCGRPHAVGPRDS